MAAGEWILVQAQVELFAGVLNDLKARLIIKMTKTFHKISKTTVLIKMLPSKLQPTCHEATTNSCRCIHHKLSGLTMMSLVRLGRCILVIPVVYGWFGSRHCSHGSVGLHGVPGIALAIILTSGAHSSAAAYTANRAAKVSCMVLSANSLIVVFAATVTYGIGHAFALLSANSCLV